MVARRKFLGSVSMLLAVTLLISSVVDAQSLSDKLNELGPEGHSLAAQAGVWDVTETEWATPDAKPIVTKGVAVRRMIGSVLQETLHPGNDLSDAAISRIDYLSFNRIEGRWNYVSMDMRDPLGIMTANSFERDPANRIEVVFAPFALPGNGSAVSGQMLRMNTIIETSSNGNSVKNQYFILADGVGRKWLAHRYAYTRRLQPGT
jgi:hypothetical protein